MTVLVLSNQTDTLERALNHAGHDVLVCLTEANAALRAAIDPPYQVVTVDRWTAYDQIADLARTLRGHVDQVATTWEGAIVAAGLLRDLLDLPGQRTGDAVAATDKAVMKARLADAGVPVARHRIVTTIDDIAVAARDLGWPLVVKPLAGFGSTNTHVVYTLSDLDSMRPVLDKPVAASAFFATEPAFTPLTEQRGILVEQYVDIHREYHVDACWTGGEPVYQIPGRYNVPPLAGMGGALGSVLLPADGPEAGPVVRLAEHAARTLGIRDGFTHTEIYLDYAGRHIVGEVAARPGGGGIQRSLHHAYGLDIATLLAHSAAGQPIKADLRPRPGVYGWVGPYVPDGTITTIGAPEAIERQPGVIEATVKAKTGGVGGMTGTGLWAGAAGYAFLRGSTVEHVLQLMPRAVEAFAIRVTPTRPELLR
ncbi:biotin carboxylase [Hamadaea flava]|nr:biotin carboxylase [Hamadaea flava]